MVDESVHVTQVNDDVVKFALHSPLHRSVSLEMSDLLLLQMMMMMMMMMMMIFPESDSAT